MKSYPSISKEILRGVTVYCFDKLDGNNIRAEWSRKHKKFTKFGSKTILIGQEHPAVALVISKYEKDLTDIFIKERFEEVVCFFEYYGPNSFAGQHDPKDIQTVTLIDINVYKRGILYPNQFIKLFKDIEIPKLLHMGNLTKEIEELIKNGTLEGMTFEGVVCKSVMAVKNGYPPAFFKVKNQAWIQKVKDFCKGNLELENELL